MLQEFLRQYKYLVDEQVFVNTSQAHRIVLTPAIMRLIMKLGFPEEKATEIIASMKETGVTRASLKRPKANVNVFLAQSYAAVREALGLIRLPGNGIEKLYSMTETSQVTLCGDSHVDKFRSLIVANPKAYEAVRSEFEESNRATFYQTRFNLKTFIDALYQHFLADPLCILQGTPSLISWSPETPAFRVLDPSKLVSGPTPNWDSFLSRVNFPDIFMAFVWCIFEPSNTGRQSLWIRGEGNDGKSSAVNAIAAFIGRAHVHSITKGSYNERFFNSGAYGKRLSIYMDCKNPYIYGSEKIKSMLGRDSVEIERKFENPFTAQLDNKLLVLANCYPKINYSDKSERTRLLMCEIATYKDEYGDPDFEYHLEAEFPAFLLRCKEAYLKACPNNANLRLPKDMVNRIKSQCAAKEFELMEQFVETRLVFDKAINIPRLPLHNDLIEWLQKMNIKEKSIYLEEAFTRLLETKGVHLELKGVTSIYQGIGYKNNVIDYKQRS